MKTRVWPVSSIACLLLGLSACGEIVTVDGSTTASGGAASTETASGGSTAQGGAGAAAGGSGGLGGSGGSVEPGCSSVADCVGAPGGPICDRATGACVSCLPDPDAALECGIGSYCDTTVGVCVIGCSGVEDCLSPDGPLVCDPDTHFCVGCVDDDDCTTGAICVGGQCLPGCTEQHPCGPGLSCCGQQCFDLSSDENNCGACNDACGSLPNASVICANSQCQMSECNGPFADCNGDSADGCEVNVLADGQCACDAGVPDLPAGCDQSLANAGCLCKVQPNDPLCVCYVSPGDPQCAKDNELQSCYLGSPNSENVGLCKAGKRMCNDSGAAWGPCLGQVLPATEICDNGLDEDCDGTADDSADADFDGWTVCQGDCNDAKVRVNPGALELTYTLVDSDNNPATPPVKVLGGNGLDDDCNPATLDTAEPAPCSASALTSGVTALDLAHALDLCQSADPDARKPERAWGLLSAEFRTSDGQIPSAAQLADFQSWQSAVVPSYGVVLPKAGATMMGLSTGRMRAPGAVDYTSPSPGTNFGHAGAPPSPYLMAHGGALPGGMGCNGNCPGGSGAFDGIALRLTIRVPTNTFSLHYDLHFFTAEYPNGVCTPANDFVLALLGTGASFLPLDKNITVDGLGNTLSVNNGFFSHCAAQGCFTCPQGTEGLAGTGMPAGTGLLTNEGYVFAGEVVTLDLMVFDVSDGNGDSVALFDNFGWGTSQPINFHPIE